MHFRPFILQPDNARQHPTHGAGRALDAQSARLRPNPSQCLVQLPQRLLYRHQQHRALRGERQAARPSAEQRVTQLLFQPEDLPTDGALRQMQTLGGMGEIKPLGHHHKGFQHVERR
ncbi:hypothetical protein D3C80_1790940 [compost metagenome]